MISIHALREEGDITGDVDLNHAYKFLSTPSARRATTLEECWEDLKKDFYPRPPRGGRQVTYTRKVFADLFLSTPSARRATAWYKHYFWIIHHFYPRPPRGGRHLNYDTGGEAEEFLSTPSARRATAKTERKPSAFVSLYTSLHKLQRGACKTNRKITPLLAQTAGIPVRSVRENHVRCLFALAGHQKISTLSCANSGCSPTCSTLVW